MFLAFGAKAATRDGKGGVITEVVASKSPIGQCVIARRAIEYPKYIVVFSG
jgi:hypothetical protein